MPQPDGSAGIDECAGWMKNGQHDRHQITGQMPNGDATTKNEWQQTQTMAAQQLTRTAAKWRRGKQQNFPDEQKMVAAIKKKSSNAQN
jgi:hypothetical protein